MPIITYTKLDLARLEDAPLLVTLPDELCVDLDGYGNCQCSALREQPDALEIHTPRHMGVYGANADGTPYTSRRYFRL